ncbi:hypothetical protein [Salmonella sp. s51933]|uniref:hypothetical protein n=1 Tax=Salmonella sp. s51933 TaxID=3160127 RepID=UPI0037547265
MDYQEQKDHQDCLDQLERLEDWVYLDHQDLGDFQDNLGVRVCKVKLVKLDYPVLVDFKEMQAGKVPKDQVGYLEPGDLREKKDHKVMLGETGLLVQMAPQECAETREAKD